uniref:Uncharacterized protein n=1 Tax=Magallana gigas TaxID=29159 RepID=K1QEP1_MAGGI
MVPKCYVDVRIHATNGKPEKMIDVDQILIVLLCASSTGLAMSEGLSTTPPTACNSSVVMACEWGKPGIHYERSLDPCNYYEYWGNCLKFLEANCRGDSYYEERVYSHQFDGVYYCPWQFPGDQPVPGCDKRKMLQCKIKVGEEKNKHGAGDCPYRERYKVCLESFRDTCSDYHLYHRELSSWKYMTHLDCPHLLVYGKNLNETMTCLLDQRDRCQYSSDSALGDTKWEFQMTLYSCYGVPECNLAMLHQCAIDHYSENLWMMTVPTPQQAKAVCRNYKSYMRCVAPYKESCIQNKERLQDMGTESLYSVVDRMETLYQSLQNQTSCIRNILSGMGSCVEKSVEVAIAIATSFENFLLALHHRFTCEGSLPVKLSTRAPSTTSTTITTTGRPIPDDVGSSITSSFFSQSPTPASQNDVSKSTHVRCGYWMPVLVLLLTFYMLWWRNNHDTSVNDGALHGERCYSFGSEVNLSKDSVCVSCDHLGDDVRAEDTLYDVIVSSKCGNRLCCYRDRDIWSLIHMVLEIPDQRSTEGGDLTWWYNRPDAAHLFLDHSLSPPQWSPNNVPGVSFTNLPFNNNRISIQREGLYFVYAVFSLDFSNFGPGIPQVYHNITRSGVGGRGGGERVMWS